MPKRFNATTCKRHDILLASTSLQHIWISDQLVADSFAHFIRATRRHGSNIPGPLEAHRRVSRRKNTSLAYAGAPGYAFDPAVTLGNSLPKGWWGAPADNEKAILDTGGGWLRSLIPAESPSVSPIGDQLDLLDPKPHRTKLKAVLWRYDTAEGLCAAISAEHINLRQHPELCSDILDHVLEAKWECEEIGNLLLAPQLNPPGSSNHYEITKYYLGRQEKRDEWSVIMSALLDSARLGILSVDGWKDIVRLMCNPATYGMQRPNLRECHELLGAVTESSVYGPQSLSNDFVNELISLLGHYEISLDKARLVLTLSQYERASAEDLISKICIDFLISGLSEEENLMHEFTALLGSVEVGVLIPAVVRITEELIQFLQPDLKRLDSRVKHVSGETQNHRETESNWSHSFSVPSSAVDQNSPGQTLRPRTVMEIWFSMIRALDISQTGDKYLNHPAVIELYRFRSSKFATHQKLILYIWTMMALRKTRDIPYDAADENSLTQLIRSVFNGIPNAGTTDILGKVVMTISDLPLPGKDALLDHLKLLPDRKRWGAKSRIATLNAEVRSLIGRDFEKLCDSTFYDHARRNFPLALQEMCESLNHKLPTLERISRQFIRHHENSAHIVLRILENNMELQLALNKSHNRSVPEHSKKDLSSLARVDTNLAGVSASSAVSFIHIIAAEFAMSKAISDRDAIRKTFWCYEFLNRYRAPITSVMIRALWHAGIVRLGGQASVSRIEWLLQLVKEYEGQEAARSLLFNTNISRLGPKQKEILLDVLDDKKKRLSWKDRKNASEWPHSQDSSGSVR